ncbi:MAG: response regulator [Candidatus Rokubacteria bacterium]|jgi:CheY-like chemotaxis protein|nr:response regulator [Candidatus Rokubacteria bacterium]
MREEARILVVDDEDEVRQLVAEFLEAKGYSVITAATGLEALTAVKHYQPDLVLMDIMMPKMNGLETIQRIRQIDRRVGIIMMTAVEDESIAREAMKRDAYDYITKPLDFGYLELAIITKLAQAER